MCRICFDRYKDKDIEVSDIEIKKQGVSYSVDTIGALCKIYPRDTIYFLVGSDMFLYLEKWRCCEELLRMCIFTVAYRNGADKAAVSVLRKKLSERGYKTELLENAFLDISSTELRKRLKSGDFALEAYLHPDILSYIKEKKIYVL
jgi:nicotinate-nucleotide adenylyltransferase